MTTIFGQVSTNVDELNAYIIKKNISNTHINSLEYKYENIFGGKSGYKQIPMDFIYNTYNYDLYVEKIGRDDDLNLIYGYTVQGIIYSLDNGKTWVDINYRTIFSNQNYMTYDWVVYDKGKFYFQVDGSGSKAGTSNVYYYDVNSMSFSNLNLTGITHSNVYTFFGKIKDAFLFCNYGTNPGIYASFDAVNLQFVYSIPTLVQSIPIQHTSTIDGCFYISLTNPNNTIVSSNDGRSWTSTHINALTGFNAVYSWTYYNGRFYGKAFNRTSSGGQTQDQEIILYSDDYGASSKIFYTGKNGINGLVIDRASFYKYNDHLYLQGDKRLYEIDGNHNLNINDLSDSFSDAMTVQAVFKNKDNSIFAYPVYSSTRKFLTNADNL